MKTKKVISGYTVEVEGIDCFITKGKYWGSLAAVLATGTMEDETGFVVDVPESVQIAAEKFALANGY